VIKTMQRFFDIFFSGAAIVVLSPLLIPIVLILKFTGEGKVFFSQSRVGKGGQPFSLLKFATMLENSPNIGTGTVTLKDDPRVLPFGKFLRKSKLNELPQLINILRGDMSVVGPRPQTQRCFDAFPIALQSIIVRVAPGLSGVGSIIFRDEEAILADHHSSIAFYDEAIAPYKGAVEAWYVGNASITNYFLVIFATIWVVIVPSSSAVWRVFNELPAPPASLVTPLNYPAA
jgi:lipopolysaccharide/colanic/teichoic acid biosynthesis glycosyltransferase